MRTGILCDNSKPRDFCLNRLTFKDAAMLTSDVLPLIREAADRVYSVVRETPLVPMPSTARVGNGRSAAADRSGVRQVGTAADHGFVQTARRDQQTHELKSGGG